MISYAMEQVSTDLLLTASLCVVVWYFRLQKDFIQDAKCVQKKGTMHAQPAPEIAFDSFA